MEQLPLELKINILNFVGVKMLEPTPSADCIYSFMVHLKWEMDIYDYYEDEVGWECMLWEEEHIEGQSEWYNEKTDKCWENKKKTLWWKWKDIIGEDYWYGDNWVRSELYKARNYYEYKMMRGKWSPYDPPPKSVADQYGFEVPTSPTLLPPGSPPPVPSKKIIRRRKKTIN